MFIPRHFEVNDKEEIFSFIEANAFGQLISQVNGKLFSTHMPFLLADGRAKIIGHCSVQNPQHLELDNQEVLVSLQGAHGYISPSWYSTAGVPTWNYQAVHIYGKCRTFSAPERLKSILNDLTHKYESAFPDPWQPQYNDALLGGIVGIEITITEIQCQYKLSQNRSAEDRASVINELTTQGSIKLAEAMQGNE